MRKNQKQIPATDAPSPAAWGFVLQHAGLIRSITKEVWTDARIAREDFHQDLVVDIARNHHKFDPERGSPATWIWCRARNVKDHALRRMSARKDQHHDVLALESQDGAPLSIRATGWGDCERIETITILEQVIELCPWGRSAAESYLLEEGKTEIQMSLGITMPGRLYRLRKMGETAQKEGLCWRS